MSLLRPSPLKVCVGVYAVAFLAIVFNFCPSHTDPPEAIHFQPTPEQKEFYNAAFDVQEARYEVMARHAGRELLIRERTMPLLACARARNRALIVV